MDKVICDICGTAYPENARQCPICGYSRGMDEFLPENLPVPAQSPAPRKVKGGRFSQKNVRRRTGGADFPQEDILPEAAQEEPPQASGRSNAALVILLLVLILAMLTGAAFLFIRFFLPNIGSGETVPDDPEEFVEWDTEDTSQETTEEPTIPCESLELLSEREVTLEGIGKYYLMNVEYAPLDTTDTLTYTSNDETVAVVNNEGRVETTGEGTATITAICGARQVSFLLNCVLPTEESETTEATEATEETTQAPTLLDIELYLDKSDFTLSYRGDSYQLQFNPELSGEDITWESLNPNIARVENGRVTCVSYGTTRVIARYGEQEVECIVRCAW